jgi:hypothetical protein
MEEDQIRKGPPHEDADGPEKNGQCGTTNTKSKPDTDGNQGDTKPGARSDGQRFR